MTTRKGPIAEITESQEIDYGSSMIGDVWVQRQIQPLTNVNEFRTNNRTIFPIPSENRDHLVQFLSSMVSQAQQMICLSSYMIQQGSLTDTLLSATARGVRIYVLTSGEEELERVDTDMDDVEKEKVDGYKRLLNAMAGQVLIRTAPHFHAKFLLVDPQTEKRQGVMMTCNATVDAMTGKNLEIALTLKNEEVKSFFAQFVRAFWQEAKHELLKAGELRDILPPPTDISYSNVEHPATLNGYTTLRETVKEIINSTKNRLIVSGWSFGRDNEVTKLIGATAERGVDIRVYARISYGNTEALAALVSKGVTVRGHDRCHAKMVIADSNKALLMTSNFTERGLDTGFETGLELEGEEITALLKIADSWENACEWNLQNNLQLRNATKQIRKKNPSSKKVELIEVSENITKQLSPYSVQSLDLFQKRSFDKDNPNSITTNRLFKRVIYNWKLIPPTLPQRAYISSQAKERFPVYKLPTGETFVTVNNWEEIENVKAIAGKWKAKIVGALQNNNKK